MSQRELIVLGSASQIPTRERNHNGYLLRWDREVLLFDPGEGTQRQMLHAGVSVAKLTRICITHFHGDHCLGLPGVLQRLSLDEARAPVEVYYPAEGQLYFDRLRGAAAFHETAPLHTYPSAEGVVSDDGPFRLSARALDHWIPTLGWRLEEPDGRHLVPQRLADAGLAGPIVGQLQRDGAVEVDGRRVTVDEMSEPYAGQTFAFVMDTGLCDAAIEVAAGADLLVCEATYLEQDADLAARFKHLTAAQAATIAREAGARRLVLTHFSQRYRDATRFAQEAAAIFDDVVIAEDLMHVAVPDRSPTPSAPRGQDRFA